MQSEHSGFRPDTRLDLYSCRPEFFELQEHAEKKNNPT